MRHSGEAAARRRRGWTSTPLTTVAAALLALSFAWGDAVARADPDAAEARAKPKSLDVVLRLDRRRSGLQKLARSVSDPASPTYGRYVDPEQTADRFGASRSTRRRVSSFLRRRGVASRIDVTRSFAQAIVPAQMARRLFGTSKGLSGNVPRGLRGEVRAVFKEDANAGVFLPRLRSGREAAPRSSQAQPAPPHARTGTPSGCDQGLNATFQPDDNPIAGPAFTPNQIQAAYHASRLHALGVTGAGVRAAVLGAGGFARSELQAFGECFGIETPPARLVKVGTRNPGNTSVEAALDLQMLTLMAPGLESLDVYDVGSGFDPVAFSAMQDRRYAPGGRLPDVMSVSQGDCESDLGRALVQLTEHVLASAAAAGITVAAGSGDNGSFCLAGRVGFYPAVSRWVTAVGGTSLELADSNEIADEIVWNDAAAGLLPSDDPASGGGGISRYLGAPFYQRGLASWGDRRGYPDVAAMADLYPGIAIYCGQNERSDCEPAAAANPFEVGFGTSAATPLFAGAVALANQRRLETGGSPIGFANPLLYRLGGEGGGGALRDVLVGSNDLGAGCCEAGPGFDLASGWGSVDAEGLAAAAGSPGR